ncbi:MAG: glucose-1-phosphate thymidylyltransferase RfbA [Burkholderiaceae bacterium]
MKGIILAGGFGTRLHPMTQVLSKQLLPVYDKPLIYYPISTLMLAGIKEILIITTPQDIYNYQNLLGNGENLGLKIFYEIQNQPNGLAEAFIIGEQFIGTDDVCLALGDNIFYGNQLQSILTDAREKVTKEGKAIILGYNVPDPERFGIAEINELGDVISLEEKPNKPKSNFAVVGLYFYPRCVVNKAKQVNPSERGELEITTLNQIYLNENRLSIKRFGRGIAWLDTGTTEALYEASNFIRSVQNLTKQKIACLEEIALNLNLINVKSLNSYLKSKGKSDYFNYLRKITKSYQN